MCDGPPARQTMMTARGDAEPAGSDAARRRSTSGRVSPPRPSAPTRRKSRRFPPWSVSTGIPFRVGVNGGTDEYTTLSVGQASSLSLGGTGWKPVLLLDHV